MKFLQPDPRGAANADYTDFTASDNPEDTSDRAADAANSALDGESQHRAIGTIIAAERRLTDSQVDEILLFQRQRGVRFGEAAVELRLASSDDVLWALSQQFHYPYAPSSSAQHAAELVVAASPFGEQAEAFRELRSQLMFGVLAPGEPRRALAVVSPDVGDGKTFMAANLAVAFSQLGGHTLLIDVDMRTPRQHEVFGVENRSGLSNILSGRADENVIHPVKDLPSLFVLPVGTVPPNPLELVQQPAFGMLVHELLTKFDHVIVDTPASTHGADARVIAAKCGAVLAVGRQGKSRLQAMQKMIGQLANVHCKLAGVVMNKR